ncbi:class I SAM-dependent DNA methyltransferase [Streptomyces sp. A30]|uniref:class I SAM-dependent DNA methyltransferase n=1 Tax=Streptomyces sp. A30 TaxID=2789273 RepID=UPI00397FF864
MTGTSAGSIYTEADVYEAIYRGREKDYAGEAAAVARRVRAIAPTASSLLDVACGTGSHLQFYADAFGDVAGLDISEDMIAVARKKLPDTPLALGDMRSFDAGRQYDVVTCMFSSIGYLADAGELNAALANFARHLPSGGVAVVEPWWFPDTFTPGHVGGDVVTVDGRTISRLSHSVRAESCSRMEVHYSVASSGEGIRHFSDVHDMTLFHRRTYEEAFTRAGLTVDYVPSDAGPGLFIGVKRTRPCGS